MDNSKNEISPIFYKEMELLTEQDMCALFKTSPSSLFNWRKKNAIPYFKVENSVYYVKQHVYEWIHHQSRLSMQKILQKMKNKERGKPKK